MTKISKNNLRIKSKKMTSKFSMSKHIKLAICDGGCSSSDCDKLPMLPPTSDESSDSELSPIEEEPNSTDSETSKYVSSFLASSTSTISSISEVSSYKNIHDGFLTPTEDVFCEREYKFYSDTSDETIGESSRPRMKTSHFQKKKESHEEFHREQTQKNHHDTSAKKSNKNDLNHESKKESKHVVKHSEQRRQEYRESTVVEVEQEVPFESMINGIAEYMGGQSSRNLNPENLQAVQNQAVNHLLGNTTDSIGLNRNKTFTFMMMNLSLIAANANQLKHILDGPDRTTIFFVSIALLLISTTFQIIAKITSLFCGDHYFNYTQDMKKTKCLHRFMVCLAILIAITNLGLTGVTFAEFLKSLRIFDWWKW